MTLGWETLPVRMVVLMLKGIVKWYSHVRETGLIECLDDGKVVSYDRACVPFESPALPAIGDIVEFILPDSGKRLRALFVRIANPDNSTPSWL